MVPLSNPRRPFPHPLVHPLQLRLVMHTTNRSSRPSPRNHRLPLLSPSDRLYHLRRILPFPQPIHTLTNPISTPRPPHILQHRPPSDLFRHPMESRFRAKRKRLHVHFPLLILARKPLIPALRSNRHPKLDRRNRTIRRSRRRSRITHTHHTNLFSPIALGIFDWSGDIEETFDGLESVCAEVYVGRFAAFGGGCD